MIITIDGPAGSGKSTTAQLLAKNLKFLYLDTGALYRALTLKVINKGLSKNQESEIVSLMNKTEVELKKKSGALHVYLEGKDVTDQIRSPEVDRHVTWVCQIPEVRNHLVEIQKRYGQKGSIVAEGRDLGTVVFPQADLKFYLLASLDARSKRRKEDLQNQGIELPIESIRSQISERDKLDSERELSPLSKADDAIEIDTTNLTVEQQVDLLYAKVLEYMDHEQHGDSGIKF